MSVLKLSPPFHGTAPRVSHRSLGNSQAQTALNTKLFSGDLEGVGNDVDTTWAFQKAGLIKTIYRFAADTANPKFMMWLADVDAVRGQVAGNTTDKTYYTGDGTPKKLNAVRVAANGSETPLEMGMPVPTIAISAASVPNVDDGRNEVTNYVYTFVSAWGEEGAPSPASADVKYDTAMKYGSPWMATANAANNEIVKAGTLQAKVTTAGITGATQPTWPAIGQTVVDGTVTWTMQATPASDVSISLTNLGAAPAGAYDIQNKRIYRNISGASGTQYYLVAEIPVAQATYTDTANSAAIAAAGALVTTTFDTPPSTLQGIKSFPNGVMVAFDGSDLLFSEPFLPYAWPIEYRQSTDYPIVGLGVFGNTVLVCTTNHPYLFTGTHPSNMSGVKLRERQACVSKRSIVDMGGAAIYASPDGLVMASGGDAILATDKYITRTQWQALNPSSIHAYYSEGRYIGFYDATATGGSKGGFIVSLRDPEFGFIWLDTYYTAGFTDDVNDSLYLVTEAGVGNIPPATIVQWGAGTAKPYVWKSGVKVLPRPLNYSCAKLIAATYPATVKFFSNGILRHTQIVTGRDIFRLPSGFLSDEWEIEISGTAQVHSLEVAESIEELRRV